MNCGKGLKPRVEHGVTFTSICLVLRSFTVENQLAELLFLNTSTFQSLESSKSPIFSIFNASILHFPEVMTYIGLYRSDDVSWDAETAY